MTPHEKAAAVRRNWYYRLRSRLVGVNLSEQHVAEVIEAEERERGCWSRYEAICQGVGKSYAGAAEPVCGDIARRLESGYPKFGSIAAVLLIINVILTVVKLLDWWRGHN